MKEKPKIVAFCCRHCTSPAADNAAIKKMDYPPEVEIIMLPCTGRIDVESIIQAFTGGADAVLIASCLLGDCHYDTGNKWAAKKVAFAKEKLRGAGINPELVEQFFFSGAMPASFVKAAREMLRRAQELPRAV